MSFFILKKLTLKLNYLKFKIEKKFQKSTLKFNGSCKLRIFWKKKPLKKKALKFAKILIHCSSA
jgi:hypothetical protein